MQNRQIPPFTEGKNRAHLEDPVREGRLCLAHIHRSLQLPPCFHKKKRRHASLQMVRFWTELKSFHRPGLMGSFCVLSFPAVADYCLSCPRNQLPVGKKAEPACGTQDVSGAPCQNSLSLPPPWDPAWWSRPPQAPPQSHSLQHMLSRSQVHTLSLCNCVSQNIPPAEGPDVGERFGRAYLSHSDFQIVRHEVRNE